MRSFKSAKPQGWDKSNGYFVSSNYCAVIFDSDSYLTESEVMEEWNVLDR